MLPAYRSRSTATAELESLRSIVSGTLQDQIKELEKQIELRRALMKDEGTEHQAPPDDLEAKLKMLKERLAKLG